MAATKRCPSPPTPACLQKPNEIKYIQGYGAHKTYRLSIYQAVVAVVVVVDVAVAALVACIIQRCQVTLSQRRRTRIASCRIYASISGVSCTPYIYICMYDICPLNMHMR